MTPTTAESNLIETIAMFRDPAVREAEHPRVLPPPDEFEPREAVVGLGEIERCGHGRNDE